MDVGYIRDIKGLKLVVNQRNITVGIGCQCKLKRFRKIQSFGPLIEEPLPYEITTTTTSKPYSVIEKAPTKSSNQSMSPLRIRIY